MCAMAVFEAFSGNDLMQVYMHKIFIIAGGLVPMKIAPIIIQVVLVLATIVSSVIVDRLGRRILLIFSGIGETVSLVSLFKFKTKLTIKD